MTASGLAGAVRGPSAATGRASPQGQGLPVGAGAVRGPSAATGRTDVKANKNEMRMASLPRGRGRVAGPTGAPLGHFTTAGLAAATREGKKGWPPATVPYPLCRGGGPGRVRSAAVGPGVGGGDRPGV